jgi:hypothetical protein
MTILIQDSFTDADDTTLASHSPNVGGAWVPISGYANAVIGSNMLTMGMIGEARYYNNIGQYANSYAQIVTDDTFTRLFLRYIDENNYYYCEINSRYGAVSIKKRFENVGSLLCYLPFEDRSFGLHTYRFDIVGVTLTVKRDSVVILTCTDTDIASGYIGLGIISNLLG